MFKEKKEIENWLIEYKINDYTIHDDLTVDVSESVYLDNVSLRELPVQFGIVLEDFSIANNRIASLKGCPKKVGKIFNCSNNLLTHLEGGPLSAGSYLCNHNKLTEIDFSHIDISRLISASYNQIKEVSLGKFNGSLHLSHNQIEHLFIMPDVWHGDLALQSNPLRALSGLPDVIQGYLNLSYTQLASLEGLPQIIEQQFVCSHTPLETFDIEHFPKTMRRFTISHTDTSYLSDLIQNNVEIRDIISQHILDNECLEGSMDELDSLRAIILKNKLNNQLAWKNNKTKAKI